MMQTKDATKIALPILIGLGLSHCLNDTIQSTITSVYPLLKSDLALSFAQIGLITLVNQLSASICQPLVGLLFDKHPSPWAMPIGMLFTLTGIINISFAMTFEWVLFSVFFIGVGSAVLHPEASRLAHIASGGRRGFAQSIFQVGGNFGFSFGPLLVAAFVAPYGRSHFALFSVICVIAILVTIPIGKWYKRYLSTGAQTRTIKGSEGKMPLSMPKTILTLFVLFILIFSKFVYGESLGSYYTFYLIHKFGVTIQTSQLFLFVFFIAEAIGTMIGGPLGDKIGRKYVIWVSILGTAPFSLAMPYAGLYSTLALSFCAGLIISSAFAAIIIYAQELIPQKIGLVSGLFFGLGFGIAGVASAVLGCLTDKYGIDTVYKICAFMPLIGIVACFLPNIEKKKYR